MYPMCLSSVPSAFVATTSTCPSRNTPRVAAGQRLQERDELQVGVAFEAASMDLAAGHFQRGEQAGGAVTGVIVGHAGRQSGPHRQCRLGAVERLNLGLFIHAQHQGALGRVQVQGHDIGQLGVELGVAAELEGFDPMRLQTVFLPDPVHGGGRQPNFLSQAPRTPMAVTQDWTFFRTNVSLSGTTNGFRALTPRLSYHQSS